MRHGSRRASPRGRALQRALLLLGCAVALVQAAPAAGAEPTTPATTGAAVTSAAQGGPSNVPTATLEQCVSATAHDERSATFSGEMTASGGTGRMSIRIELLERLPGEPAFHAVAAPGLGIWRSASPGVKVYRYIKQVTNLTAPAFYRAAVRFRWLNAKGKLIRATERRTPVCVEHQPPQTGPGAPSTP